MKHTIVTKIVNKNNVDHGILFETIYLIIYYGSKIPEKLRNDAITNLGMFITIQEPNILMNTIQYDLLRYLALEAICKFHSTQYSAIVIIEHCLAVFNSLKD